MLNIPLNFLPVREYLRQQIFPIFQKRQSSTATLEAGTGLEHDWESPLKRPREREQRRERSCPDTMFKSYLFCPHTTLVLKPLCEESKFYFYTWVKTVKSSRRRPDRFNGPRSPPPPGRYRTFPSYKERKLKCCNSVWITDTIRQFIVPNEPVVYRQPTQLWRTSGILRRRSVDREDFGDRQDRLKGSGCSWTSDQLCQLPPVATLAQQTKALAANNITLASLSKMSRPSIRFRASSRLKQVEIQETRDGHLSVSL